MDIRQAISRRIAAQLRKLLNENSNLFFLLGNHSLARIAFDFLMSQKMYDDADQLATILLSSDPDNIKLYICRLQFLSSKGSLLEFESLLKHALRVQPKNFSLLWSASKGLQTMGRYELSLSYAKQCLGKKKTTLSTYMTTLQCQLACGEFDDSENTFHKAFQMVDLQTANLLISPKKKTHSESNLLASKRGLQKLKFQHLSGLRIKEARSLWCNRSVPNTCHCDVICIASDEAPYLHEFIHHYLYLGFSNIFIGINNSSDHTEDFALKLAATDPRVHVMSTDDVHVELTQRSSYSKLYRYAASVTSSSYCLFVDVDEFWVAQPFPMNVDKYLEHFTDFDCLSSNWVNCFYEHKFSPPLTRGLDFRLKRNVKSFVAYKSDLVELRCHSPVFRKSSARVLDAFGNPQSLIATEIGFEAPGKITSLGNQFKPESHASIILHRHNRSVLEYSYRMFKPHANQVKFTGVTSEPIPFKDNRPGCNKITGKRIPSPFVDKILPLDLESDYYQSLKSFIQSSGSESEIENARLQISDQEIKRRISEVEQSTLLRSRPIWERGFWGTPYLELLQERCNEN